MSNTKSELYLAIEKHSLEFDDKYMKSMRANPILAAQLLNKMAESLGELTKHLLIYQGSKSNLIKLNEDLSGKLLEIVKCDIELLMFNVMTLMVAFEIPDIEAVEKAAACYREVVKKAAPRQQ